MSVKNRIVIYSATGVDIIFGWNIKRISNGDYRLGDIVYPFKFPSCLPRHTRLSCTSLGSSMYFTGVPSV